MLRNKSNKIIEKHTLTHIKRQTPKETLRTPSTFSKFTKKKKTTKHKYKVHGINHVRTTWDPPPDWAKLVSTGRRRDVWPKTEKTGTSGKPSKPDFETGRKSVRKFGEIRQKNDRVRDAGAVSIPENRVLWA